MKSETILSGNFQGYKLDIKVRYEDPWYEVDLGKGWAMFVRGDDNKFYFDRKGEIKILSSPLIQSVIFILDENYKQGNLKPFSSL